MTYTLYNRVGSAGFAVEATLTLARIEFELVEIDSAAGTVTPPSFRAINPWGQLPTLILDNGDTLTESAAIYPWLASRHEGAVTGPEPGSIEYARFLRWIVFGAVNVHEAASRRNYPERFTTDPGSYAALGEAASARMRESLETIDQAYAPGTFLINDELCSADIYLAMLFTWYRDEINAPHLQATATAVSQHPAIQPIWERHSYWRAD